MASKGNTLTLAKDTLLQAIADNDRLSAILGTQQATDTEQLLVALHQDLEGLNQNELRALTERYRQANQFLFKRCQRNDVAAAKVAGQLMRHAGLSQDATDYEQLMQAMHQTTDLETLSANQDLLNAFLARDTEQLASQQSVNRFIKKARMKSLVKLHQSLLKDVLKQQQRFQDCVELLQTLPLTSQLPDTLTAVLPNLKRQVRLLHNEADNLEQVLSAMKQPIDGSELIKLSQVAESHHACADQFQQLRHTLFPAILKANLFDFLNKKKEEVSQCTTMVSELTKKTALDDKLAHGYRLFQSGPVRQFAQQYFPDLFEFTVGPLATPKTIPPDKKTWVLSEFTVFAQRMEYLLSHQNNSPIKDMLTQLKSATGAKFTLTAAKLTDLLGSEIQLPLSVREKILNAHQAFLESDPNLYQIDYQREDQAGLVRSNDYCIALSAVEAALAEPEDTPFSQQKKIGNRLQQAKEIIGRGEREAEDDNFSWAKTYFPKQAQAYIDKIQGLGHTDEREDKQLLADFFKFMVRAELTRVHLKQYPLIQQLTKTDTTLTLLYQDAIDRELSTQYSDTHLRFDESLRVTQPLVGTGGRSTRRVVRKEWHEVEDKSKECQVLADSLTAVSDMVADMERDINRWQSENSQLLRSLAGETERELGRDTSTLLSKFVSIIREKETLLQDILQSLRIKDQPINDVDYQSFEATYQKIANDLSDAQTQFEAIQQSLTSTKQHAHLIKKRDELLVQSNTEKTSIASQVHAFKTRVQGLKEIIPEKEYTALEALWKKHQALLSTLDALQAQINQDQVPPESAVEQLEQYQTANQAIITTIEGSENSLQSYEVKAHELQEAREQQTRTILMKLNDVQRLHQALIKGGYHRLNLPKIENQKAPFCQAIAATEEFDASDIFDSFQEQITSQLVQLTEPEAINHAAEAYLAKLVQGETALNTIVGTGNQWLKDNWRRAAQKLNELHKKYTLELEKQKPPIVIRLTPELSEHLKRIELGEDDVLRPVELTERIKTCAAISNALETYEEKASSYQARAEDKTTEAIAAMDNIQRANHLLSTLKETLRKVQGKIKIEESKIRAKVKKKATSSPIEDDPLFEKERTANEPLQLLFRIQNSLTEQVTTYLNQVPTRKEQKEAQALTFLTRVKESFEATLSDEQTLQTLSAPENNRFVQWLRKTFNFLAKFWKSSFEQHIEVSKDQVERLASYNTQTTPAANAGAFGTFPPGTCRDEETPDALNPNHQRPIDPV